MIKYFAVENFRSIKEENIVEFDVGLPKDSSFVANPTIGIAGANASGKSSFLQALNFTIWFMKSSFLTWEEDSLIPLEPFITCHKRPTKLHLIFSQKILVDSKEKFVDFEYALHATKERVIEEEFSYYPYNRKRIVYQRNQNRIKQGSTIAKLENELWKDLRENCSIVSYASQFGSQVVAREIKKYNIATNLSYGGMDELQFHPQMLESLLEEHELSKEKIITFLKIADLGIHDFKIFKKDIFKFLIFKHQIDEHIKDFAKDLESEGTLQFIALAYNIIQVLSRGEIVILDEIEIKLHQNLVAYIIGLFQNKYENPHGAG